VSECATVRLSRAIEVAAGVFAPGHLGGLTPLVPFELVDSVLADCRRVQRRLRVLPARVGVYLVLAAVLFPRAGLVGVWARLTAGLGPVAPVSEKALRDLRRRVGPEPIKALFDTVAGPTSWPGMPGVRYRRWRTVAFDGCGSIKMADTGGNRVFFGHGPRNGEAGYPMLGLLALVETGTRALIGAVFGPARTAEIVQAQALLPRLAPDMLVLADRGFDAVGFLAGVAATGAGFLVRATSNRALPVLHLLPDGSYLSCTCGLPVRVIRAAVTATGTDGSRVVGHYRLLTTLTCHRTDPAAVLVRLYHERWEIESAFYALRHTLAEHVVLRSGDPAGIAQQMWATLTVYQILRTVMADAVATRPGTDPDRAGFTTAVNTARDTVINAQDIIPEHPGPGPIETAVLAHLLPARRARYSARALKCRGTRYPHPDPGDHRPAKATVITAIDIAITAPATPTALPPAAPALLHTLRQRHPATGTPVLHAIAALHTTPGIPHRARDLARAQGLHTGDELNAFCVALNKKASQGHLTKTAPATYMITSAQALTTTSEP
jgi:hypothetical protein